MPGLIEIEDRFIPWGLHPEGGFLRRTGIYQLNRLSGSTWLASSQLTGLGFSSRERSPVERSSARTRVPPSIILHVMVFPTTSSPELAQPSGELSLDDEGSADKMVSAVVTFEVAPNEARLIYSDLQPRIVLDSGRRPDGTVTYWHYGSSRTIVGPTVYQQQAARYRDQDVLPHWITMDPRDDVMLTYEQVNDESQALARLIVDCSDALYRHVPLSNLNTWGNANSESDVSFWFRKLV